MLALGDNVAEYDSPELLPLNNRLNTPTFQSLAQARNGTDPYNRLGSELGSALFGGGARDARAQQVFDQSAKNSATIADVMMQARQRRDAEIGRQALAQSLDDKGDHEGASLARSAQNPQQFQAAMLDRTQRTGIEGLSGVMGKVGYTPEMSNLFGSLAAASKGANLEGDTKSFASLGTPYAGTPAVGLDSTKLAHVFNPDSTKVAGGLMYDEGAPATQALVQTPEGAATVGEKNAQAARAYAGASSDKAGFYHVVPTATGQAVIDVRDPTHAKAVTNADGTPVSGLGGAPQSLGDAMGPPDASGNAPTLRPNTGESYLATLPPDQPAIVRKLGNYEMDPRYLSTKGGHREQLLNAASTFNPDYDSRNFVASNAALQQFGPGKKAGDTVKADSVAIDHLTQLGQLGEAMQNGNSQAVNQIRNAIKTQFGYDAPTNFNALQQIVGAEVVKAIVGAGGGVTERENAAKMISSASSPQQLTSAIKTVQGAMGAQLSGLQRQYEQGTLRHDFNRLLSPAAQQLLSTHNQPTANINQAMSAVAAAHGAQGGYQPGQKITIPGKGNFIVRPGGDPNNPDLDPAP